jgi:tol-pal system protein YbgF
MSRLSKVWLVLVCLLSYFSLGQAGCQTLNSRLTSQEDIDYLRSDLAHMRRDIEEIKKNLNPATPMPYQDILRNQAAQREALIELHEGQQRLESKTEETGYQLDTLRQEVTNLKLNVVSQLEAMRTSKVQTSPVVLSPTTPQQYNSAQQAPKLAPSFSVPAMQASQGAEASSAPKAPSPSGVPSPQVPEVPSVPSPPKIPPIPSVPQPAAVPSASASSGTAEKVASTKVPEIIDYTKLYDTAYEDYVRQSYPLARSEFEEYLRRFPETDLADNAQYWIGECFFAEGKYEQAADAFKKVIERYPTGNKVPRAMLKAGYALLQLGRDAEAKDMFQQVMDAYPLSSEADQAKIKLRALP